jgi:3-isopropylmalate dehydrogenase
MMLHESFGLTAQSFCLQAAINEVLAAGWRTKDVMAPGCTEVGTREMVRRVTEAFRERLISEVAA